jgi:biopolymer transport protein ExbD
MTVSIKADKETKMGVITDVKQALREAYALKISYSALGRSR